jgi:hypothetical protein
MYGRSLGSGMAAGRNEGSSGALDYRLRGRRARSLHS